LAGCGFRPLHGPAAQGASTISDMAYVEVAPIPERIGQLVRDRLLDIMHPDGTMARPVYRLEVAVAEVREGLAFERDDSVTRFNLRLTANFSLIDKRAGREVTKGNTRAVAAYNVVRSDYANVISQRDARRRAAHSVASGIQKRLAVYFARLRG
jgi:LPS-assembly lipoprotein